MSSNENTPEPSAEVRRDRLSRMVVDRMREAVEEVTAEVDPGPSLPHDAPLADVGRYVAAQLEALFREFHLAPADAATMYAAYGPAEVDWEVNPVPFIDTPGARDLVAGSSIWASDRTGATDWPTEAMATLAAQALDTLAELERVREGVAVILDIRGLAVSRRIVGQLERAVWPNGRPGPDNVPATPVLTNFAGEEAGPIDAGEAPAPPEVIAEVREAETTDDLYGRLHSVVESLNLADGWARRLHEENPEYSPFTPTEFAYLGIANDLVRHVGRRIRPASQTFAKATDEVSRAQVLARHAEAVRMATDAGCLEAVVASDGMAVVRETADPSGPSPEEPWVDRYRLDARPRQITDNPQA
jgi:hypothetical protein